MPTELDRPFRERIFRQVRDRFLGFGLGMIVKLMEFIARGQLEVNASGRFHSSEALPRSLHCLPFFAAC